MTGLVRQLSHGSVEMKQKVSRLALCAGGLQALLGGGPCHSAEDTDGGLVVEGKRLRKHSGKPLQKVFPRKMISGRVKKRRRVKKMNPGLIALILRNSGRRSREPVYASTGEEEVRPLPAERQSNLGVFRQALQTADDYPSSQTQQVSKATAPNSLVLTNGGPGLAGVSRKQLANDSTMQQDNVTLTPLTGAQKQAMSVTPEDSEATKKAFSRILEQPVELPSTLPADPFHNLRINLAAGGGIAYEGLGITITNDRLAALAEAGDLVNRLDFQRLLERLREVPMTSDQFSEIEECFLPKKASSYRFSEGIELIKRALFAAGSEKEEATTRDNFYRNLEIWADLQSLLNRFTRQGGGEHFRRMLSSFGTLEDSRFDHKRYLDYCASIDKPEASDLLQGALPALAMQVFVYVDGRQSSGASYDRELSPEQYLSLISRRPPRFWEVPDLGTTLGLLQKKLLSSKALSCVVQDVLSMATARLPSIADVDSKIEGFEGSRRLVETQKILSPEIANLMCSESNGRLTAGDLNNLKFFGFASRQNEALRLSLSYWKNEFRCGPVLDLLPGDLVNVFYNLYEESDRGRFYSGVRGFVEMLQKHEEEIGLPRSILRDVVEELILNKSTQRIVGRPLRLLGFCFEGMQPLPDLGKLSVADRWLLGRAARFYKSDSLHRRLESELAAAEKSTAISSTGGSLINFKGSGKTHSAEGVAASETTSIAASEGGKTPNRGDLRKPSEGYRVRGSFVPDEQLEKTIPKEARTEGLEDMVRSLEGLTGTEYWLNDGSETVSYEADPKLTSASATGTSGRWVDEVAKASKLVSKIVSTIA